MLTDLQRAESDALACTLLRLVDQRLDQGDRDGALIAADAADAVLAMLDHDGMVQRQRS